MLLPSPLLPSPRLSRSLSLSASMEGGEMGLCRMTEEEPSEDGGIPAKIAPVSDSEGGTEEEEGKDLENMQAEEDTVTAVMKWLEEEIRGGGPSPSSSSVGAFGGGSGFYYQAPSFVTINGNEESCGPSFSDAASTVMASIDTRGLVGLSDFSAVPPELHAAIGSGPWCSALVAPAAVVEEEEEDDDAWLARVLGWPEFELEEDFLSERM